MKPATIKDLKKGLNDLPQQELIAICLRLSRFKKENKELLTYLLFDSDYEEGYIGDVKNEIDEQFELINKKSYFYIRKSLRKILNNTKKYIRYSQKKETEVILLLHFAKKLTEFSPSIKKSPRLVNMYNRLILQLEKVIKTLHEDLQYDYLEELSTLRP